MPRGPFSHRPASLSARDAAPRAAHRHRTPRSFQRRCPQRRRRYRRTAVTTVTALAAATTATAPATAASARTIGVHIGFVSGRVFVVAGYCGCHRRRLEYGLRRLEARSRRRRSGMHRRIRRLSGRSLSGRPAERLTPAPQQAAGSPLEHPAPPAAPRLPPRCLSRPDRYCHVLCCQARIRACGQSPVRLPGASGFRLGNHCAAQEQIVCARRPVPPLSGRTVGLWPRQSSRAQRAEAGTPPTAAPPSAVSQSAAALPAAPGSENPPAAAPSGPCASRVTTGGDGGARPAT